MSTQISITGYGFSKRLCNDVVSWYIRKHLLKYRFFVSIHHRGLKRENVYGYCDFEDNSYRPRDFVIEIDTYLPKKLYVKTLLHEMTHLRQWLEGTLQFKAGKLFYNYNLIDTSEYWKQPHEIEAHAQEELLFEQYVKETNRSSYFT